MIESEPPIKRETRESVLGLTPKCAKTWDAKSVSFEPWTSLYFCKAIAERKAEIFKEEFKGELLTLPVIEETRSFPPLTKSNEEYSSGDVPLYSNERGFPLP